MKVTRYISTALLLLWACLSTWAAETGMPMGIPFFTNFKASEYGGHNRNFDILCDDQGYTFVANFDGLLVYDNVEWRIIHTPGITRLTHLWFGENGHVWFHGPGVEGFVSSTAGDSIRVEYTLSDATQQVEATSNDASEEARNTDRWNGIEINQRLTISPQLTILATTSHGIIAIDEQEKQIHNLNRENGLCSNNINRIAYDGKGSVWGATDNGLFRVNLSPIYTRYGEDEGLEGQVNSILYNSGKLMVGTLQGLYELQSEKFIKKPAIELACWQLVRYDDQTTLAAAAQGLYIVRGSEVTQLYDRHTLSVLLVSNNQVLTGSLDGIYLNDLNGKNSVKVSQMANVTRLVYDPKGGIWALSPERAAYCPTNDYSFHERPLAECPISILFEYTDDHNNRWYPNDNGYGLQCQTSVDSKTEGDEEMLRSWVHPLASYSIQAMFVKDGEAWVGGNFGLIRVDFNKAMDNTPLKPKLYIRKMRQAGRDLEITFANDKTDPTGATLYSYRMHNNEQWQPWDDDQILVFRNLYYGSYDITVRSVDAYGQEAVAEPVHVDIPYPLYLRWYALLLYILIIASLIFAYMKYREAKMRREKLQLERIVQDRTSELRKANQNLKEAQDELVRKEREAMVGKLTQGLIDRILNPMNYINNFSHLSIGLANDLKANVEDEAENMTEDNYEDSLDVISMLHGNLEKIEQHGLSTTRILKAMEEMLRERTGTRSEMDLGTLLQQNYDMMLQYYAKDIAELKIEPLWQKPDMPIIANVIGEQLSRTIMSMIGNSIYALRKKADKHIADFRPQIRLSLLPTEDKKHVSIQIYDNGIGIEESIQQKVFDPFFTTKPTGEAPGVGLYLSQQIVQDMGGHITLNSIKDQFTEFTITL